MISPSYNQYRKHLKTEHNVTRFHCRFCDFKSEKRIDLNEHLETQHRDDTFDCLECRYKGKTRGELSKHIITAHRLCRFCEYRAPNKMSLENHLKANHSHQPNHKKTIFKCEKCAYQTLQESQLISHRYVHIAVNM